MQTSQLQQPQRLDVIQLEPPFPLLDQEDKKVMLCSQDDEYAVFLLDFTAYLNLFPQCCPWYEVFWSWFFSRELQLESKVLRASLDYGEILLSQPSIICWVVQCGI